MCPSGYTSSDCPERRCFVFSGISQNMDFARVFGGEYWNFSSNFTGFSNFSVFCRNGVGFGCSATFGGALTEKPWGGVGTVEFANGEV